MRQLPLLSHSLSLFLDHLLNRSFAPFLGFFFATFLSNFEWFFVRLEANFIFASNGCSVESHKKCCNYFFHRFYCALFPLVCLACQHFDWDSRWKFPIIFFFLIVQWRTFRCCLIKCTTDERVRVATCFLNVSADKRKAEIYFVICTHMKKRLEQILMNWSSSLVKLFAVN